MYTPHSLEIALLMMITSAICWGSWANTYKGVKNYRFELFYWDYAVGIFLISLIFAFTLGSTSHDPNSFLNNVHSADTSNIVSVMIGGAIFNLANLLLVAAIDMAGLAVAFPISIGFELYSAAKGQRRTARGWRGVRADRSDLGRQSLCEPRQRRPARL
jgi:glucose uptake protein